VNSEPGGTYLGRTIQFGSPITLGAPSRSVESPPSRRRPQYLCGIDLGQAADYTALVVLEITKGRPDRYECPWLERLPLGVAYPEQSDRIAELVGELRSRGSLRVVVDATGVGRAVVQDLRRRLGVTLLAVTITGGNSVSEKKHGEITVPKRDLVSAVKLALQTQRLRIAKDLPEAETLVRELLAFQAKITVSGHDTYEAWREGEHDDLVLALALALWLPESRNRVRLVL
jgi:hypothetical protein